MMMGDMSNRCPFTASQWQELEHQALIFNYMVSGTPIPHGLILPIKTFYPEPNFPHQSRIVYQMDFEGKGEDPEPGRCRRTDGKKWRCSKEAYPDSKYCEKHMHRGKNRSRKHVEAPISGTTSNSTGSRSSNTVTISPNPFLHPRSLAMAAASEARHAGHSYSSARDTATGFPSRSSSSVRFNHHDTASSLGDKDFRSAPISVWDFFHHGSSSFSEEKQGWKDDVDGYGCFSGVPTDSRDRSRRISPLGMGASRERGRRSRSPASPLKQKSCCFTAVDLITKEEESRKRQHCFVLGADFMSLEMPAKAAAEEEEPREPLRHFFDDCPSNSKDPWLPFTTL
ncbi:hypothetical protein Taro_050202 [Colocasia esculenta]|uniref:Growth-regulating factor n=1 Tax=Colocasia esculenta TaxID=4460 RepID=A0A843XD79_COLES|nr:hypothetical protein [Colocasia esculenta]